VGKSDRYEVDFVAERHRPDLSTDRLLVQVTASMLDPQTRERELRPLRLMRDAPGAKLVVTLDRMGLGTEEGGIEVRNALDWLCEAW
jgi:predicted AAA+ superfamily ATPase